MTVVELLDMARAKGIRLATAESCTGGMVSAALTDIPGSSDVVECGFVTHSNKAKISLLGVTESALISHGAVSESVAREMADGALKSSDADIAISITGIAGPGGSEHKPEGLVCFGIAQRGRETHTETVEFGALGRDKVRKASTGHALDMIADALRAL